jgi:hypothetical protein
VVQIYFEEEPARRAAAKLPAGLLRGRDMSDIGAKPEMLETCCTM